MRHGFKSQAERRSAEARTALGLSPGARIDPWAYARHLGIVLLEFEDLELGEESRQRLLYLDPDSWSGMTIREGSVTGIVLNPSHAPVRQASTLMHEIAHVILKHVPARVDVSFSGLLLLSEYSEDAEAEADWLAAALLLPRETLMKHRRKGDTVSRIATMFGTSEQLCEWRIRMTGVDVQLRRMAAR